MLFVSLFYLQILSKIKNKSKIDSKIDLLIVKYFIVRVNHLN